MTTQEQLPGMPQPKLHEALKAEIISTEQDIADIEGKLETAQLKAAIRISLLERRRTVLERALADVKERGWGLPAAGEARG